MRSLKQNDPKQVKNVILSERLHAETIIDKTSTVWGRYNNLAGQYRVNRRSAIIASYSKMNSSARVLEIGSGTGEYTKSFSKYAKEIFSVDISWDFLDLAKKRNGFTGNRFCQAAVEFMPFKDNTYDAVLTSIKEIKARGSPVLAIAQEGDESIEKLVDSVITVPWSEAVYSPVLNTVALQLLAYYTAGERGCPIDFPRNLAKSVTVE